MDDQTMEGYNVPQRVDDFVAAAQKVAAFTRGNDIMMMMGTGLSALSAQWNELHVILLYLQTLAMRMPSRGFGISTR
jgi:hypothetical protein